MAVVTETRGPNLTADNDPLSFPTQTTTFWSPCELDVSSVLWKVAAGTYELYVDGALINTRTLGSTTEANMLSGVGNLALDTGPHELQLKRTSGGNWRYYADKVSFVDEWFHLGSWEEVAPGDGWLAPVRLTADLNNSHYNRITPPTTTATAYPDTLRQSWPVTVSAPKRIAGLTVRGDDIRGEFYVEINGRLVGASGGGRPNFWASDNGAWVRFWEPFDLETGTTYLFRVRMWQANHAGLEGSGTYGIPYGLGTSWTPSGGITYGKWIELDEEHGVDGFIGHELISVAAAVPNPAEISERRGWDTYGWVADEPDPDFGSDPEMNALATQTTEVWFTVPCELDDLWWYVPAGSYQLRIDGVLRATKNPSSEGWQTFLNAVAPVALDAGVHEVQLTRTAGAAWAWDSEFARSSHVDAWFHMRNWLESDDLAPGLGTHRATVPLRVRIRFDPAELPRFLKPVQFYEDQGSGGIRLYNEIRWTATFASDTYLHGITLRENEQPENYRLYIDGVEALRADFNTLDRHSMPSIWMVADPPIPVPAGDHELAIRISDPDELTDTWVNMIWSDDDFPTPWTWNENGDIAYTTGEFDTYQTIEPVIVPTHDTWTAERVPAFDLYYTPSDLPLLRVIELEAELFEITPPVGVRPNSITVDLVLYPIDAEVSGPAAVIGNITTAINSVTGGSALTLAVPAAGAPIFGAEILLFFVNQRSGVDIIPPAGLTEIREASPLGANPSRNWFGYRVIDGTETPTYVFGFGSGGKKVGSCIRVAGVSGAAPTLGVTTGEDVKPWWDGLVVPASGSALIGVDASTGAGTNTEPVGTTRLARISTTSGNACGQLVWRPTADNGTVDDGLTADYESGVIDANVWTALLVAVAPMSPPTSLPIGCVDLWAVLETPFRGNVAPVNGLEFHVDLFPLVGPLLIGCVDIEVVLPEIWVGPVDYSAHMRPGSIPIA